MCFDLSSALSAYYSCRNGKRKSVYQLRFERDLERNMLDLRKGLIDQSYKIGTSTCFVITYPSTREIFAANFVDRVIHHLLINNIEEEIDKTFIYDSFACRKLHGVVCGVKRLRFFLNMRLTG